MGTNMIDLWQLSDEVECVVTAVLGDCQRWIVVAEGLVTVELGIHLSEENAMQLCSQFYSQASYDGEGERGSMFTIYPRQE